MNCFLYYEYVQILLLNLPGTANQDEIKDLLILT